MIKPHASPVATRKRVRIPAPTLLNVAWRSRRRPSCVKRQRTACIPGSASWPWTQSSPKSVTPRTE
eukprot:431811-Rhodomonas_salina.1